jgi:hypothetical protein
MILEKVIIGALQFYGPLYREEIMHKLDMRGWKIKDKDVDQAIKLLVIDKKIKEGWPKGLYKV